MALQDTAINVFHNFQFFAIFHIGSTFSHVIRGDTEVTII